MHFVEKSRDISGSSFMETAIYEAQKAADRGSVPIGAVVIGENRIISFAGNEVIKRSDPTAHAEIIAIRQACGLRNTHILNDCDMYVTLEPCPMCAQAISLARIRRLYFGAYDPKYGGVEHGARIFDHAIHKTEAIGGVLATQCAKILKNFFENKRN
ncbi:MAG: nucleoside deaminase [Holosporaceae bacterium]|jgi:tRNA(adenine34) deaminase|nr:nucleoside deaminase [Holosporaceae bacterium]